MGKQVGEFDMMLALLPGGIEVSERVGQIDLVHDETLPADMGNDRALLESWGVKILGPVQDDPLFVRIELPRGWRKRAEGHAMHSSLLDDSDRVRAEIFYKAAFYDRRANMSARQRYSHSSYGSPRGAPQVGRVTDADGTVLFETAPVFIADDDTSYKVHERLDAQCIAWLNERRPMWRDKATYWEDT